MSAARGDDRLAFIDQAAFLQLRSTGPGKLGQISWIYEHDVDDAALARFHANLGHGLLGRRIECSPLPFGRHRWVASPGPPLPIDTAPPRPRSALSDWLDERAELTVDPEHGPAWHLGVLPMTDGSTGISLVASHCLTDGVGILQTIAEAAAGTPRDFGYAPAASRRPMRGVAEDLQRTVCDAPEYGRTVAAAVRLALRRRHDIANSGSSRPPVAPGNDVHGTVVVPVVNAFVGLGQWDAAAAERSGTSYSLLAGFSARLAERMGRMRPGDGAVSLLIAMSDRTAEDTRANAISLAHVEVDPAQATADLSAVRAAIRQGLAELREVPDETFALLPLTPFVPRRAVRRTADLMFGDLPVSCSNVGDLDPMVGRPDGTDAEYVLLRGVDQDVRRASIERAGGHLVVVAGRINGAVTIGIVGYQPGGPNTKDHLRQVTAATLAEFGLTAEIV
ncbi:hypothetical protein JRC04_02930 [Mycolicibacterium sp. S2-37]|uniref:hypothetical protein n=1 Tax=Mycolicibacterium sp. S2-37 TaxID=2810297 RepID=UPI001A94561D|nr:hypothetical protein [Mycolicibacterium sp. S2-37]MBO0676413.1 hypothetical protein [Mycolicibacterium sp. S2-37]